MHLARSCSDLVHCDPCTCPSRGSSRFDCAVGRGTHVRQARTGVEQQCSRSTVGIVLGNAGQRGTQPADFGRKRGSVTSWAKWVRVRFSLSCNPNDGMGLVVTDPQYSWPSMAWSLFCFAPDSRYLSGTCKYTFGLTRTAIVPPSGSHAWSGRLHLPPVYW